MADLGMGIGFAIALNQNSPAEALAEVYRRCSEMPTVYRPLTMNPNTPAEVLTELAKQDPVVMYYVVDHPNCPSEILAEYVKTAAVDHLVVVKNHANLDKATLQEIERAMRLYNWTDTQAGIDQGLLMWLELATELVLNEHLTPMELLHQVEVVLGPFPG